MPDAIAAARDLLTSIPLAWRKRIYGTFGLIIVLDGLWDVIPESYDSQVVATFATLGLVLARVNASDKPLPPPVPVVDPRL
jgi:hypothetical protein